MPEHRLKRTRATLPEGYQFPTPKTRPCPHEFAFASNDGPYRWCSNCGEVIDERRIDRTGSGVSSSPTE